MSALPKTDRDVALMNLYAAERRAGARPEEAHERLTSYAKRLDALFENCAMGGPRGDRCE